MEMPWKCLKKYYKKISFSINNNSFILIAITFVSLGHQKDTMSLQKMKLM